MKTPDNAPDIKVGHKTPDEIKKGLECCTEMCNSESCPYWEDSDCTTNVRNDAIALIKQLEAERDAAVADITRMVQDPYEPAYCDYCKMTEEECEKRDCKWRSAFVWRGIQKEATP